MSVTLTGVPDADRQILINLDDRSLAAVCSIDRYMASICSDDLWRLKLNRLLGGEVADARPLLLYQRLVRYKNGSERLIWASKHNRYDLVRLLLDNRANIHVDNDYPLMYAAQNGNANTIRLLLNHGADIHARNDGGGASIISRKRSW